MHDSGSSGGRELTPLHGMYYYHFKMITSGVILNHVHSTLKQAHKPELCPQHMHKTVSLINSLKHYFLYQTYCFRSILNIFGKSLICENPAQYKICTSEAWICGGKKKWDLTLMKGSEHREIVYKFFAVV